MLGDARGELVEDGVLDQQPGARGAGLAVVEQESRGHPGDRGLQIRIGEDHLRALAAELERDFLEVARCGVDDLAAHLGGSREGDLVDAVVRGQRGADVPEAGQQVEHACGHTGLGDHLGQQQRGQRVCSAGLRITVLPHASAGATLNAAMTSGKFHGMIWAHTPTGPRS